ncbi:Tpo4p Ecym_6229 [Eremothecium cymbalariae DBVPG|uniref:Major facilitator superfamily (MFS) profile domain-containing protein n=1 Tax=Eremothecium cymbalariae (strain CBS 270.75 / DBVPG 7215 / KCTC 17166 / NRRL Y-17582) TaxID=931890 RepID=G8JVD2_ERECY|nr:hypothetical protein Ecym_6229 [Eremothecium cymbalariae DBVPG\
MTGSLETVGDNWRSLDRIASGGGDNTHKKEGEEGDLIDPKDLDWDDRYDEDNPHNWPVWKKWYTTLVAAFLCLVVSMGSSLYVSAVPELVLKYNIDQTLALAGLTFYLLGLAMVVGAPLSEVYGRKPIYLLSLPPSMLFALGVGFSGQRMGIILPLRFLSGVFASPALSVASGTIVDIFDVDQVSVAMASFCMAPFLGPVISPIMAGFAAEKKGWKWGVWIHLIAGAVLFPFVCFMPESHRMVILRKRAAKRGLSIKKMSREEMHRFIKMTFTVTVFRPIKMLFVEPIVLVFSVYVAFVFAVLFAFFEAYPIIFRQVYHFSMGESGLTFLGISVGLWIGTIFYIWYDRKYYYPAAPEGTPPLANPDSKRDAPLRGRRDPTSGKLLNIAPEEFLLVTKVGSIALPAALFWMGWSAKESVHWMVPLLAGVPFGFGLILIFFSVLMYFTTSYPVLVVSSAFAANNMLRYITSCVFPLFTVQMYNNLGIDWASSLFGFISLAMVPVPWIFERYGKAMRKKSVFGYDALKPYQGASGPAEADSEDTTEVDVEVDGALPPADLNKEKYSKENV